MAPKYRNLVDVYEDSCERFAHRDALGTKTDDGWEWTSYAHLKRLIDECRGGLAALGVEPGDRVAIISNNRLEWAVAAYATYGLEAVFVPMYEAQLPKEWTHILTDSGAKVCLTSGDAATVTVKQLLEEIDTLERVVGLDLPPEDSSSFRHLLGLGEDAPVEPRHPDPDATAGFIYTSGTTGLPKGVVLTHGNLTSNLMAVQEVFPLEPDDRSLAFLPWAHSFGQTCELHYGLSQGIAIAVNDEIPKLLENLAEVKPTVLVAVPRIFNKIYDSVLQQIAGKPAPIRKMFEDGLAAAAKHREGKKDTWLHELELKLDDKLIFSKIRDKLGGQLKLVISGSAKLSREVAELVDALGVSVYEGYGLSETSPVVSANTPTHHRLGTAGKVLPGVRVEIDESMSDTPTEGEIIVYGPNVMKGYHNLPDKTAEAFTEDGGFRTGDLGYVDEDGYLVITGRIKEQFKLETGKYVMPGPVEEHLKLSPYIANIMVHGEHRPFNVAVVVPDRATFEKWAEKNEARLGDSLADTPAVREVLETEIRKRGDELRAYEVPKRILVVDEDFTTDNGMLTPTMKLKRRNVLKRYGAELDALYLQDGPRSRA